MNKKKSRNTGERPQLAMTPMIDVVFQLLIFFLVTLKPEDILSHLDVTRPQPDPTATEMDIDLLTVTVYNHQKMGGEGYAIHGNRVSIAELERQLAKVANVSKTVSVLVRCTSDSPHSNLVKVLDICAKLRLAKISVFSM